MKRYIPNILKSNLIKELIQSLVWIIIISIKNNKADVIFSSDYSYKLLLNEGMEFKIAKQIEFKLTLTDEVAEDDIDVIFTDFYLSKDTFEIEGRKFRYSKIRFVN